MKNPALGNEAAVQPLAPDRLDRAMRVVNPAGWVALATLAVLVGISLAWAIFGTITISVPGRGVIVPKGGFYRIRARQSGVVMSQPPLLGEIVHNGQPILRELTEHGTVVRRSETDGRIVVVNIHQLAPIAEGDVAVVIEPLVPDLVVVAYIPAAQSLRVHAGLTVRVAPSDLSTERFGFILGRVNFVSPVPINASELQESVGLRSVASDLAAAAPQVQVGIRLDPAARRVDAFRWTMGAESAYRPRVGTICDIAVDVASERPIAMVIGAE